MNEIQQLIADMVPPRTRVIDAIVATAALAFGLSPEDILGRSRMKSVTEARQCVCFVARRCTRMSYAQIGKALDIDHTSVMTAVKRIDARRQRDEWLDAAVKVLVDRFGEIEGSVVQ